MAEYPWSESLPLPRRPDDRAPGPGKRKGPERVHPGLRTANRFWRRVRKATFPYALRCWHRIWRRCDNSGRRGGDSWRSP